ncbi:hypothetical protein HM1_0442 [Heliomicrobium modesticaldum Ice1]|uniref:Uncharacterized protein n=1 Tax=Heliobacterium modesticaldum (strain ATCC 51547 / Ice1) TaxID=498761 RepID=B0TFG1_HELMI|nr:hypothetical protein HM1_0442 [Heliomicrobium modesticaldum Ice1]
MQSPEAKIPFLSPLIAPQKKYSHLSPQVCPLGDKEISGYIVVV